MDPVTYHAHHVLRSEDMAYWRGTALDNGGPVLELGCGTGRVLLRLLRDSLMVDGLDNDPTMLQFINRSIPPKLSGNVSVFDADMRDFSLDQRYPLVILPCNTLSTFNQADRVRVFSAVRQHLTPEGMFVFSIPNPLLLAQLPETGDTELEDEFTHPATGNAVEVYSSWNKNGASITFEWKYLHHYPDHVVEETLTTTHYLDPPQDYLRDLKAAALSPKAAFGDFYKARFEPESPYFIIEARIAGG